MARRPNYSYVISKLKGVVLKTKAAPWSAGNTATGPDPLVGVGG